MDNRINTLLLFLVVFAPLAFGSIDLWSNMVVEITAFTALLMGLAHRYRSGKPLQKVPGLLPLSLCLCWMAIQLIPLPMGVLSLVSPKAAELYTQAALNTPDGVRHFAPITIAPRETLQELLRFSAYAAIYISIIQFVRTGSQLRRLVTTIVIVVSSICIIGILQHYTGTTKVWWIREFSVQNFFGTFAYKNHFGALVCMIAPLIFALYLYYQSRSQNVGSRFFKRMKQFLTERHNRKQLLYGLAIVLVVLALGLSESRGGMLCTGLALALVIGLNRKKITSTTLASIACLVVVVLLTGVGRDALHTVDQRVGRAVDHDIGTMNGRTPFWQNSIEIFQDYFITGAGAGSFASVYPSYLNKPSGTLPQHAHNEYLESLVTNGVVGSICIAWFIAAVCIATYRDFTSRRDKYIRYLYTGMLAGAISFLVHSFMELNFHISSSVGMYFFLTLGLLCASTRISQRATRSSVTDAHIHVHKPVQVAACAVVSLLLFSTVTLQGGELYAALQFPDNTAYSAAMAKVGYEKRKTLNHAQQLLPEKERSNKELIELSSRAAKAAFWAPLNALYPYLHAQTQVQLNEYNTALPLLASAQQKEPTSALYFKTASTILAEMQQPEQAIKKGKHALRLDPGNYPYAADYAAMLLQLGMKDEAFTYVPNLLSTFPGRSYKSLALYTKQQIVPHDLAPHVPDSLAPQLALAKLYEQESNIADAAAIYNHAQNVYAQTDTLKKNFFWQPYGFFMRHNQPEKALEVLRTATHYFPDDFKIRVRCAELYQKQGLMSYGNTSWPWLCDQTIQH